MMRSRHVPVLTIMSTCTLPWIGVAGCATTGSSEAMSFPGPQPGRATARVQSGHVELGNKALTISWNVSDGMLTPDQLIDHLNGATMNLDGEVFRLVRADGNSIRASDLRVVGIPRISALRADGDSPRLADRYGGRQIAADLEDAT